MSGKAAEILRLFPERARLVPAWLHFVYSHFGEPPQPALAMHVLEARADLVGDDLMIACAVGDLESIARAVAADAKCVSSAVPGWRCPCGAAFDMPPLIAVTHSSLIRIPRFQGSLRESARVLLAAGADPNSTWRESGGPPLSALYGAAGLHHDVEMTRLLLDAGASPDDGESLYHAFEGDDLSCARLLLEAGATRSGTNATFRILDVDRLDGLELLLSHGADPNERSSGLDVPLHHAIRRRRSPAHIRALLEAGADPRARTSGGISAFVLAHRYGLTEVVALLGAAGAAERLAIGEQFIAACARGDRDTAVTLREQHPDLPASLSADQLAQLPNLAAEAGTGDAIELMVELGWPVDVRGGIGWVVSALNHAVARGDAVLTHFLLENGAKWTEDNGHGSDVSGTLAWASRQELGAEADLVACAEALMAHGMPRGELSEKRLPRADSP